MAFDDWFEPRTEREQDILRVERSRVYEVAARGSLPIKCLEWDEHRDTFATVAEFRTHDFAAKLTFDDADGGYELTVAYRKWYGRREFRLRCEGREQAQEWLDRCVMRHPFRPFVCRVDY